MVLADRYQVQRNQKTDAVIRDVARRIRAPFAKPVGLNAWLYETDDTRPDANP